MNLAQLYSLTTGKKLSKIKLLEKFYPLPFERIITFQPFSKDSKVYDLWQEVLNIIYPILEKENIKIVQIGAANEKGFPGCYHTQGTTNLNQCFYLISKSLLNLSTDSFSSHVAGIYTKPLVCLFSNNYSKNVGPFYGDKNKQILLEPNREKFPRPSYSFQEFPKSINSILPEIIAQSVLKLLNLSYSYPYKSLFFGGLFNQQVLEGIPNQTVDLKPLGTDSNFVMRMDILFNEEFLFNQLKLSKCLIYTDRPINKDLIRAAKPQIQEVIYELNEHNSWPDYIEFLQELGVKFTLLSYLPEDKINGLKLQYFDYGIIHKRDQNPPKEIEGIDKEKIYYKTNRYILSNQKIYTSLAALKENRPVSNFGNNIEKIPNDSEFWKEKDFIYLLEK